MRPHGFRSKEPKQGEMQVEQIVAIPQRMTSIPKLLTHIHIKWRGRRNNMQAHPEEFGSLFQTIEGAKDFVALS